MRQIKHLFDKYIWHWKTAYRLSTKLMLGFGMLLALAGGIVWWYIFEQGNFHTITPGEAYRCCQMDRDEWEYYFKKYGIRSLINLRGENANREWYQEEKAVCQEYGVKLYDVKMSGGKKPPQRIVQQLENIIMTAPRPVLFHCITGGDRTGLAAYMWRRIADNEPREKAMEQMSWYYLHIPFGKRGELDKFAKNYDPPVTIQKRTSNNSNNFHAPAKAAE